MQCGPGPKTSTRRARKAQLCLINQLRRESAGLLRSHALLWRGDSLDCSIMQQDGAGVISGAVISGGLIGEKIRLMLLPTGHIAARPGDTGAWDGQCDQRAR